MKPLLGWIILLIAAPTILLVTLVLSFKLVPSISTSYAVWIYDKSSEHETIILKATLPVEKREPNRYLTLSTAYDAMYDGDIYQVDRTSRTIAGYGDGGTVLESSQQTWSTDSLREILEPFQTHIRTLSDAEVQEIKSVVDNIIANGYDGMFYALQDSPSQNKKTLAILNAVGPAGSPFVHISYGWVPVWIAMSSIGIWGVSRLTRPLRKSKETNVHSDAQTPGSVSGRES